MKKPEDMSPETRERHEKHVADVKSKTKNKQPDERDVGKLITHLNGKPIKKKITTVTSENKAEHDKKFMNARAGKKEEPKFDRDELKKKYKENESNNYHTENALMLAQNYGTKREQNALTKALEYRNKAGGYKSDDPMANLHYKTAHEIHSKYWPHLHDEEE